jgi:hypothetical protein
MKQLERGNPQRRLFTMVMCFHSFRGRFLCLDQRGGPEHPW